MKSLIKIYNWSLICVMCSKIILNLGVKGGPHHKYTYRCPQIMYDSLMTLFISCLYTPSVPFFLSCLKSQTF